jgi:2-dehydro-3-deoxygluconokinase
MIARAAFATAVPEEFDFAAALDGAALFHISGITAALGPGGVELARAGIKAASGGRADQLRL